MACVLALAPFSLSSFLRGGETLTLIPNCWAFNEGLVSDFLFPLRVWFAEELSSSPCSNPKCSHWLRFINPKIHFEWALLQNFIILVLLENYAIISIVLNKYFLTFLMLHLFFKDAILFDSTIYLFRTINTYIFKRYYLLDNHFRSNANFMLLWQYVVFYAVFRIWLFSTHCGILSKSLPSLFHSKLKYKYSSFSFYS